MRLLFYDRRSPWFNSCQIIVLFALLFSASAETTQTVESTTDKESGTTTVLTSAATSASVATSAATSAKSVETTETTVITTTNVPTTTGPTLKCTKPINKGVPIRLIMEKCIKEDSIILLKWLFDISNIDEKTANSFLSKMADITDGGLRLAENNEIKTMNIIKLRRLGDPIAGGLEILDTHLEWIEFVEDRDDEPGLFIRGKIKVRGNRYLNETIIEKIKSIGIFSVVPVLEVQKFGECVIHPDNINLKDCLRVYKDLHLKDTNLTKVAPDFQPEAISGCLKIEESVTLHKSTFEKLLENTTGHKEENECEGESYVKTCIMKTLYNQLKEAFNGTFEEYKADARCKFICNMMEDIVKNKQERCTVIEGNVKIDNATVAKLGNLKQLETILENVEIVYGQILIDGTEHENIFYFNNLHTIVSGEKPALVVRNNTMLEFVAFDSLKNISSTADKSVIFTGNGEYVMEPGVVKKLRSVVNDANRLDIEHAADTSHLDLADPDSGPKKGEKKEKPKGEADTNQAKQDKPNDDGDAEGDVQEDYTVRNALIAVGVVGGCFVVMVAVAVIAIVIKRKLDKKKKPEVSIIKSPSIQQKPDEEKNVRVETKDQVKPDDKKPPNPNPPNVPLPFPVPPLKPELLSSPPRPDEILFLDEKKYPDPIIIIRMFNLFESIASTPVLFYRQVLMHGDSGQFSCSFDPTFFGGFYNSKLKDSITAGFDHDLLTVIQLPTDERRRSLYFEKYTEPLYYDPRNIRSKFRTFCGIGIKDIKETMKALPYKWEKIDIQKHPLKTENWPEKPFPSDAIEASYYFLQHNTDKKLTIYLEFFNFPASEDADYTFGNLDQFNNTNLVRFVHWAYSIKAPFFTLNQQYTFLIQLFMVAFYFILGYKAISTVDHQLGVHLCIVVCTAELLINQKANGWKTLGKDTWSFYPPEIGHIYAMQMLKYIAPFVEEKQKTNAHYASFLFKNFEKDWAADRTPKEIEAKIKYNRKFVPHRRDFDSMVEKRKAAKAIVKRYNDERKAQDKKGGKQEAKEKQKVIKEDDRQAAGKDKGKKGGKEGKDFKGKDNQAKPTTENKETAKDTNKGKKATEGKKAKEQPAGEKSIQKSGQDSGANPQNESDINVQPQEKAAAETTKDDVSKMGQITQITGLFYHTNKMLALQYIANTLTMNNIVKKYKNTNFKKIDWKVEWPEQARFIYYGSDFEEEFARKLKELKNDVTTDVTLPSEKDP